LSAGKLLKDLTLEEWRDLHPAIEADIYQAIAPERVVAARNSYGGTGFQQIRQAIERAKSQLLKD
jgi:argininosuccinate lyase